MTWNPGPVADERHALATFLRQQHAALRNAVHGLTDEQARSASAVGTMTLAALLHHVTITERIWMERAYGAEAAYDGDDWDPDDATLKQLLAAFDAQTVVTEHAALDPRLDLDATHRPPQGPPWYTGEPISGRWILFHLLEELARHAGHADLVREHLDGAVAADLMARVEGPRAGWPVTGPSSVTDSGR